MRILLFSHSFGAPTTTFIRNETNYFSKSDQIRYVCNEIFPGSKSPDFVQVIPFHENRVFKKVRWLLWKYDLACFFQNKLFSKRLNMELDSFRPDIIHCHFAYEGLMLLDNLAQSNRTKVILHFHGYDATRMMRKRSYVRRLNYYLSKDNIYIITCNRFFLDKLKLEIKLDETRATVLKYGIDVDSLFVSSREVEIRSRRAVFVQVSSLAPKKGHEYTLHAYKLFLKANPDIQSVLKLTGSGTRLEKLKLLANSLQISENVEFLGSLSPEEVSLLLGNADVFVHHSVTDTDGDMEGIPNAIIEAMAMQLPVVSTIHSGIPELVEDGVNGYLVEEGEVIQYSIRMKDALGMGKLQDNRTKIMNEYSVELHNRLLSNFYRVCLDS